jgi:hypothetical protein
MIAGVGPELETVKMTLYNGETDRREGINYSQRDHSYCDFSSAEALVMM